MAQKGRQKTAKTPLVRLAFDIEASLADLLDDTASRTAESKATISRMCIREHLHEVRRKLGLEE